MTAAGGSAHPAHSHDLHSSSTRVCIHSHVANVERTPSRHTRHSHCVLEYIRCQHTAAACTTPDTAGAKAVCHWLSPEAVLRVTPTAPQAAATAAMVLKVSSPPPPATDCLEAGSCCSCWCWRCSCSASCEGSKNMGSDGLLKVAPRPSREDPWLCISQEAAKDKHHAGHLHPRLVLCSARCCRVYQQLALQRTESTATSYVMLI